MSFGPVVGEDQSTTQTPSGTLVTMTVAGTVVGVLLFVAGLGCLIYSYWQEEGFNPRTWTFWAGIGGILLGLIGFVALYNANQQYAARDPVIRQTLTTYNFVLVVCFLAGILIVLNLLVAQFGYLVGIRTYDWTQQGVYTLSEVTVNHLRNLKAPVKVIVLYPASRRRSQLESLLELYEAQNPRMFDYEVVDYLEQKLRAQELLRQYPDLEGALPGVVVIYGEGADAQHKVIRDSELFETRAELDPLSGGFTSTEDEFNGENAITSAIRALSEARKTKVYFVTGHGELDPDDRDPSSVEGIGVVRDELEKQHVEVDTFNLVSQEVPDDADLVVIARPRSPFTEQEVQRLRDYLDRKDEQGRPQGRLLVLVDSPLELRRGVRADLNLNPLLNDYKVELADNVVIDTSMIVGQALQFAVQVPERQTAHEMLKPLANELILFVAAREVKALEDNADSGQQASQNIKATSILSTTGRDPRAWAEGDYEEPPFAAGGPNDTPGPVSLVVAVEYQEQQAPAAPGAPANSTPVMVVVGDATLATNLLASARPTNLYFVLNAINWLGGRVEDLGIPPKKRKAVVLNIDRNRFVQLVFEPAVALVAVAIVLGGMVWVVRTDRLAASWIPMAGALAWIILYGVVIGAILRDVEATRSSMLRAAAVPFLVWIVYIAVALAFKWRSTAAEAGYLETS